MHRYWLSALVALLNLFSSTLALDLPFTLHNESIDGLSLFYREAGSPENPTILLLHGSPDSSYYYRSLIPYLADACYHVLAPDLPGFGFTSVPASRNYTYSIPDYATTLDTWLTKKRIKSLSFYVFDIGGPVGFTMILTNKYNVQAIVNQNAAIYTSAFGPGIQPLVDYGKDPSNQTYRQELIDFLAPESVMQDYIMGAPNGTIVPPSSYTLASAWLAKNGSVDVVLSTFKSFADEISQYINWQQWLKQHQPPLLAIWGKNDPAQLPAGAEAFKQDLPNAEVVLVDAGHFALETSLVEIGSTMVSFLQRAGVMMKGGQ